jgi:hypothetical protein
MSLSVPWVAALTLVAVIVGSPATFLCDGFVTTVPSPLVHRCTTIIGGSVDNPTSNSIASYQKFHAIDEEGGEGNDDKGILLQRRRVALNNMFRNSIAIITMTSTLSLTSSTSIISRTAALALDMDAFETNILSNDTTKDLSPTLNDDEALCKYGAPGKAMGEACSRAKMQRKLPGNVDVTGKVDRGDYLKCRYEYPIIDGQYVKTRVCKPSGEEW